jgi:peptidylprolyl isomerase
MRLTGIALALLFVTSAAGALVPSVVEGQTRGPIPAPPDVAAVPADATRTATGLASKVVTPGTGDETPQDSDVITVHYTGWSADGRMFDSSVVRGNPGTFPITRVLPGWRECVMLMKVGEKRRCWVPESLGYRGAAGRPRGTTVFDIELIETRRNPNIPPPDVAGPPPDAKKTATGISYKVLKQGIGARRPQAWSRVVVHYTGWTTDGKMFDTSITKGAPMTLSLEDVIRGWTEGVQLMVEGETTRFWIPQDLAYKGEAGSPRGMLVFDIELVRIEQ